MTTAQKDSSAAAPKDAVGALFSVGAHFGYSKSRRHPSMKELIFGTKDRVEIFDLEKTNVLLDEALAYVRSLGAEGKTLLFVGSKPEAVNAVKNGAGEINMPFVAGRWLGGTLSNFPEIKKRIARLAELTADRESCALLKKYTKKERLLIDREITKLERNFGGISSLTRVPDALFIVDSKHESIAVAEARGLKVPIIALVNSDSNRGLVTYPMPGNDAALESITFFVSKIVEAYKEGRKAGAPIPAPKEG